MVYEKLVVERRVVKQNKIALKEMPYDSLTWNSKKVEQKNRKAAVLFACARHNFKGPCSL